MDARILVVKGESLSSGVLPVGPTASDLIVVQVAAEGDLAFQQVLNRIKAALAPVTSGERLVLGEITVDFRNRRVTSPGAPIHLTTQEFELLEYLAERRNRVVTRDDLLRDVWKYGDAPLTRSVDNAVARLRKKIEPCPQSPRFIHTVHRDGYRLVDAA